MLLMARMGFDQSSVQSVHQIFSFFPARKADVIMLAHILDCSVLITGQFPPALIVCAAFSVPLQYTVILSGFPSVSELKESMLHGVVAPAKAGFAPAARAIANADIESADLMRLKFCMCRSSLFWCALNDSVYVGLGRLVSG